MSEANAAANVTAPQTASPTESANPINGQENQSAGTPIANAIEQQLYELKINGQTKKFTLDQLKMKASLADAANERFDKANEIQKREAQRREALKKDFIQGLLEDQELGLTKEQIRSRMEQWYKEQFIDPEMLTAEERKIKELETYKEQKEREAREQQEKIQKYQQEQMEAQARDEMQKDIIQALEKSNLPKNRFTVSRYAYWMRQNLSQGYDAPMDVITQQVKEETRSILKDQLENASIEQLTDLVGEDFIKKLRKHDLERLKTRMGSIPGQQTQDPRTPQPKNGKPVRMSDVDEYFRSLRVKS